MIVKDERDTYAGNFDQLSSYDNVTMVYQKQSWVRKILLHRRGISKTISNFMIDKSIDNYMQTWWNIYDNPTMPIK